MNITTIAPNALPLVSARRTYDRGSNPYGMKICATRCVNPSYAGSGSVDGFFTPNSITAAATVVTFKKGFYFPEEVFGIRLVFSSATCAKATQTDAALGNALTLTNVGFQPYAGATPITVTFNGSQSYAFTGVNAGEFVVSDPINVRMAAGSTGWVRTCTTNALTTDFIPGYEKCNNAVAGDCYEAGANLALSTTDPSASSSSQRIYGPMGVLGNIVNQQKPVYGFVSDSNGISAGASDEDQGTFRRALAGSPYTGTSGILTCTNAYYHAGRSGSTMQDWLRPQNSAYVSGTKDARTCTLRGLLLACCDVIVIWEGTNDMTASLNNCQSRALDLYARFSIYGPVMHCTVPPRTTSAANNWANPNNTTGDQVVTANETTRTTFNDWLRNTTSSGAMAQSSGRMIGCLDICRYIEVNAANALTTNGGFWLTNGTAFFYTDDGIHLANNAAVLAAPSMVGLGSLGLGSF